MVTHLPPLNSDHTPLLIQPENISNSSKVGFRFQAAWLTHPEFKNEVQYLWNNQNSFPDNIKTVATGLSSWNLEVFGNIFINKQRLWARIAGVQRELYVYKSNGLLKPKRKLRDLDLVLHQKE